MSKKTINKNIAVALFSGILIGMIMGALITFAALDKGGKENNPDTDSLKQDMTANTMEQILEEEGFVIETPFADLHYPEKWEENLRVEVIEDDVYAVQFFATLEGREEVHLFDIVFGSEEGNVLGYFEENGEKQLPVNIVTYDFESDKDWTDEEVNMIYTMLEDVNYIIGTSFAKVNAGYFPLNPALTSTNVLLAFTMSNILL